MACMAGVPFVIAAAGFAARAGEAFAELQTWSPMHTSVHSQASESPLSVRPALLPTWLKRTVRDSSWINQTSQSSYSYSGAAQHCHGGRRPRNRVRSARPAVQALLRSSDRRHPPLVVAAGGLLMELSRRVQVTSRASSRRRSGGGTDVCFFAGHPLSRCCPRRRFASQGTRI